jgi:hypothetical protein
MDADRIVEIAPHERQYFRVVVGRKRLVGDTAVAGVADDPAVTAIRTARERDRKQQNSRAICRDPQVQPEFRLLSMPNPRLRASLKELPTW